MYLLLVSSTGVIFSSLEDDMFLNGTLEKQYPSNNQLPTWILKKPKLETGIQISLGSLVGLYLGRCLYNLNSN